MTHYKHPPSPVAAFTRQEIHEMAERRAALKAKKHKVEQQCKKRTHEHVYVGNAIKHSAVPKRSASYRQALKILQALPPEERVALLVELETERPADD